MKLLKALALFAVSISATSVSAAPWTHNLYFENDLFANTDQSYTNGIRVAWVSPDIANFLDDPAVPGWMQSVNQWFEPLYPVPESRADGVDRNIVFTLGQQMYTPEDRHRTTVDPNDRPYAGWLYAGMGYHAKTRNVLNSLEVNIGVVGPASQAKEAQDIVHRARGIELFEGWHNQLNNELGIQLVYEQKRRVLKQPFNDGLALDVITHTGGSLGNVATYLNAGAEIRFGWHLPDDFGTAALRPGGDNSAPGSRDTRLLGSGWGLHGFISLDGRLVAHNIFLDGNTLSSSHSVDKRYFVADAALGVATTYENWKASFAIIHRTKEFKGQTQPQSYGSLAVSYTY